VIAISRMRAFVERSHRLRFPAIVGGTILLAGIALVSCHTTSAPTVAPRPRVLLVGIDGASPKVLDAMFAAGRMKNLRSIAQRGAYGPLQSEANLLSPRVWTTIATGKVRTSTRSPAG